MSAPAMAEIAIPPEGFAYGEDGAAAVYSPRAEEAVSARPEAGAISTKDGAVTIEFGSGNLAKYEVLRAIGTKIAQ